MATGAITAHFTPTHKHLSTKLSHRLPISLSFPTHSHAPKQRRKLLVVRNSDDGSGSTATEQEIEPAPEVPKGPPSLISSLNVEKALRGLAITDVDHYARLGLQPGCPYDQVSIAYKSKVQGVMNKGLEEEEEEISKELELLKESYSILSSVEERRMYDWCLARSGQADTYTWPFEVDITQTPKGDPPPQEAEDEGPTTFTRYLFLSWLFLSFALLIAFNR